jgi:hypothetical protein
VQDGLSKRRPKQNILPYLIAGALLCAAGLAIINKLL